MLRLGLSTVGKTTSGRVAMRIRSPSALAESRFLSSQKMGGKRAPEERPSEENTKTDGSKENTDALRQFFEKRRESLNNGEAQAAATSQHKNSKSRNQNRNRNFAQRRNNNGENASSGVKQDGESDALQSFFDKRRAALRNEKKGRDISPNNNNNNNRQQQRSNDRRSNQNAGNRDNRQNGNNRRQGQRQQTQNQRNRKQQKQQENQGNDSSRLADLMKQLRRDGPVKPAASTTNNDEQPHWRRSSQQQQQRGGRGQGDSARWRRSSFLNKNEEGNRGPPSHHHRGGGGRGGRGGRGGHRQQQVFRADIDFLEGRRGRLERDKAPGEVSETVVTLPGKAVSLTDLSALFRVKVGDLERKLRSMGERVPKNEEYVVDVDMMELLAMEFRIDCQRSEYKEAAESEDILISQRRVGDEGISLPPRPPVVCIMGHVDHGKTTLMDALRRRSVGGQQGTAKKVKKSKKKKGKKDAPGASSDVAGTEAGGITQIISAFQVAMEGQDMPVTFLDTPGHAAFRSMRQSGSHAADVIVLVVAADDGISEQTIEILDFYKAIVTGSEGGISLVVALNKIDKPGIDVDEAQRRIEGQLMEHGITPESMGSGYSEYGAPVQVIPTSGLTGVGLDDLMEGLLLQSEVMDLRADEEAEAEGIIMDAAMEKGLGAVATAIIRWGNMKPGDVVVSGDQIGRVRILRDVQNKPLKKGVPSQPVSIVGFKTMPKAGDPITCVESEEKAEELVQRRASLENESIRSEAALDDIEIHIPGMRTKDNRRSKRVYSKANIAEGDGFLRIPVIVKAAADGSLSAVRESLVQLGEDSEHKVMIDPVSDGIGDINATDIQMAKESNAIIFSFGNKRVDQLTLNLAESEGVRICSNPIIYSLLDEAKQVLGTFLPPSLVEHVHGSALVQEVFSVGTEDGSENVAGLKVMDGYIYKDKTKVDSANLECHFRVMRDGKQISPQGEKVTASSLRRYKELVQSVRLGDECGLGLSGFGDFEPGDTIECYSIEMKYDSL
mmetsp:Transcript_2439/g.5684  ORF Transcript_2439/g.5684 Transcript_2439/m.5684 type:complete len:1008 (+) Transcript_2439:171-3194(+)|eukprot:CAMPEP_0113622460 /NCGR_PEP_ID=MMETSP0017_2-20120614/11509_1 /TAXON_ID=2856 /ORGANISM="Cylindrotheca closterium" /LENGTH=1007 /DNA_ID=CAMNT_0000532291 /DNA_START=72 /DNA_END=3095 /DNA_ORIENTATION=- /assembly_acc=CAM_ASM_000147